MRSVLRATWLSASQRLSRLRWRRIRGPLDPLTPTPVACFDDRVDRLWERSRDMFEYAVVRDQEYLNWRFCDPRAGVYEIRAAERPDGELAGYVVISSVDEAAQVVDLLAEPGNVSALRVLAAEAIGIARSAGAATLDIAMPRRHPYRETLLRVGFVKRRPITNLGFSRDRPRPNEFLLDDATAIYHYAFGDSDHI